MTGSRPAIYLLNEPPIDRRRIRGAQALSWNQDSASWNVRLRLQQFIRHVNYLPDRVLDLLEIAAGVFAADRLTKRGRTDQLEYLRWSRRFSFHVRVRDYGFWSESEVVRKLSDALKYLSGDWEFEFRFYPGHKTPPTSLFDSQGFDPGTGPVHNVALFSGGLDSLSGAVSLLNKSSVKICLVSHQSGQPSTKRTQRALVRALQARFPGSVFAYEFECGLRASVDVAEETQRTRAFLYSVVAFALAQAYGLDRVTVFENGVTSINVPRRGDQFNARTSRTTHPRTLQLLGSFLSTVAGRAVGFDTPFLWNTKREVLEILKKGQCADLISSAVSCGVSRSRSPQATHCGVCFQCVDRRLAVSAANCTDYDDAALYGCDFTVEPSPNPSAETVAIDYLRQAREFAESTEDGLWAEHTADLEPVLEALQSTTNDAPSKVYDLLRRHGSDVNAGLETLRDKYAPPLGPRPSGYLLQVVGRQDFLRAPADRLALAIAERLQLSLPLIFRRHRPKHENELNDAVEGVLSARRQELLREHPTAEFALARAVADHALPDDAVLVESKYPRKGVPVSKITDAMAADLVKYPQALVKLFIVYDPDRVIRNDSKFSEDFERRDRKCSVTVVR